MITLIAFILLFILTFFIRKEGFYDPSKEDQRPFNMESHSYDGNLYQAEKILYDMINQIPNSEKKNHLGELLNLLQFI